MTTTTPPTLNGKYVLERRLGAGGMAEVFLARTIGAEGFSRPVAIKRVLDGYSQHPVSGAHFAKLFIEEAQLCARLQHPNIVSVLDFDRDAEGRLFLVMELVEGTDLSGLLARGPLPFSLVIHLTIEILRGLGYAHELPIGEDGVRGLIHRDVSPQNVLLSWEGAVKVSDFGIAKVRAATVASGSASVKGKPMYMSPEQINGRPMDGRSDLFAVGVMLFEMLTGELVFGGQTVEEIIGKVLFAPIPDVRGKRPEVPEDLAAVVSMLLARDPAHRFATAGAAIAALSSCRDAPRMGREELIGVLAERFVERAPIRARTVRRLSHSEATIVAPTPLPKRTHSATKSAAGTGAYVMPSAAEPPRSRRWMWAVLASILVVGAAIAVLLTGERQRTGAPTTAKVAAPPSPGALPPAPATVPPATPAASATPSAPAAAQAGQDAAVDGPRAPALDEAPPKSGGQGSAAPPVAPAPSRSQHPSPPRREPAKPSKSEDIHELKL